MGDGVLETRDTERAGGVQAVSPWQCSIERPSVEDLAQSPAPRREFFVFLCCYRHFAGLSRLQIYSVKDMRRTRGPQ